MQNLRKIFGMKSWSHFKYLSSTEFHRWSYVTYTILYFKWFHVSLQGLISGVFFMEACAAQIEYWNHLKYLSSAEFHRWSYVTYTILYFKWFHVSLQGLIFWRLLYGGLCRPILNIQMPFGIKIMVKMFTTFQSRNVSNWCKIEKSTLSEHDFKVE